MTKPADLIRAEALIEEAARDAREYAARIAAPKQADPVVRWAQQVSWMERDIKKLCQEVAYYQAKCEELERCSRALGEHIHQLQFDAAGDDDGEDLSDERRREAASFARSTGAAAALRGEPS